MTKIWAGSDEIIGRDLSLLCRWSGIVIVRWRTAMRVSQCGPPGERAALDMTLPGR
nr:hypothetical protein JVH1_1095 [Rhodococcus sp. JVH1]